MQACVDEVKRRRYRDHLIHCKGVPVLPYQAPGTEEQENAEPTAFAKPQPKVDARLFVDLKHALEKRDIKAYKEAHRRAHRRRGDAGDDPAGNRERRDSRNVDHEIDRVLRPLVDKDPEGAAEFLARAFPSEDFKHARAYGVIGKTSSDDEWGTARTILSVGKMEACVQQIWALSRHGWPVLQAESLPTDMDDSAGEDGW
eukprot:CAMPEP_0171159502 /NCGR_PEP_ID=MMETSP0790-20130122/3071_1 /TAXON_ID=2925 /ORGANISM="Alexandrium catenella, Strain OF101" /LENGTH=199 /DNA_ID=CAMNT_0011623999 /DNA_START=71 /DNA_END=667 /DNA_ORIENTATION=-